MHLIAHPHLLVRATNERFLPAWVIFRASSASESHWLQPVPVLTVHWWPVPVSVDGLLLVHATNGQFPREEAILRVGLANESHWL